MASAKGKKVQKQIIYKKAQFHRPPPDKATLKMLMERALNSCKTVGQRRVNVGGEEEPIFHVLGSPHSEPKGFVFGALMTYSPGTDPLYLVDDEAAVDVLLEKLSAPATKDGKRREFLESLMFFGVFDNHLVMMQSQSMKSAQLERFMTWFLHTSGYLAGDNTFQLVDTPPPEVREKMKRAKGVKAITLGGGLSPHSIPASKLSAEQKTSTGSVVKSEKMSTTKHVAMSPDSEENGRILAALKALLKPSQAATIDFNQLTDSNIEMFVTLKYNRETTVDGQKLMDGLGAALRNTDEVETKIELVGGGSIKGSEIKLSTKISVTSYDGQLSHTEVFEEMRKWLLSKVTSGELSAS